MISFITSAASMFALVLVPQLGTCFETLSSASAVYRTGSTRKLPAHALPAASAGTQRETHVEENSFIPRLRDRVDVMELVTFDSKVADGTYGYLLYLPPAYEKQPERRFPVIYWLHGLGVDPSSVGPMIERWHEAIQNGEAPPAIVISCTDPVRQSMWCDHKSGGYPVETALVDDLIPHVDATYRTIADREHRAVEGWSMGGFGAAHLGFKYPELFGHVSMMGAALWDVDALSEEERTRRIFEEVFDRDAGYYRANSPWTLVRKNAETLRGRTRIRMHVGSEDELLEKNKPFHAMLNQLDIEHEYGLVPGVGHDRPRFYSLLEDPFAFYRAAWAGD